MTAFLLDVNVLISLMWPAHESHARAQDWFSHKSQQGWATCPFTQAVFVKIITNPGFSRDALSPERALKLLHNSLKHPAHQFWPDELSLAEALQPFLGRLAGHQQVTDAYLLGLTIHKKGKLATMDRSVLALLSETSPERDFVALF
jgi:toxin-antitoxin system PIN domain toxin